MAKNVTTKKVARRNRKNIENNPKYFFKKYYDTISP